MELCVLQHSSASSVEKLDEIAGRFPELAYMLNQIAIEIIDMQEAAEKHDADIEKMEADCNAEIKETCDDADRQLAEMQSECEETERENAALLARMAEFEATDVEGLLQENKQILDELDTYKSRHNTMGTADFIEQNQKLFTWANFLSQRLKSCAFDIDKFTHSYRGKFKGNIDSLKRAMRDDWMKSMRELSTITAPVSA